MSQSQLDTVLESQAVAEAKLATAIAENELHAVKGTMTHLLEDEWSRSAPVLTHQDSTPRTVFASATTRVDDRMNGRDRVIFENEVDLNKIRQAVRIVANSSVNAIGARMNLTNYVIGTGFQYEAVARDGVPENLREDAERAAGICQMAIDAFDELNVWQGDLEREVYDRTKVDGEQLTTLFPQADGTVVARQAEPEQLCEPPAEAQRHLEDWLGRGVDRGAPPQSWSFGVHKDTDDVQTVHGYHLLRDANAANWEYYPSSVQDLRTPMLHHIKQNVNRNTSRGISDFYSVIDEIVRTDKTRRNIGESASVAAAIAWIEQHAQGQTASTVSKMTTANRTSHYNERTQYGDRQRSVQQYNPATVLRMGGKEFKDGPMVNGANNFILVMQAALRMIGARWNMPEFMISGDASNGNYASIKEAGTPFVKFAQQEQQFFARNFREIMWSVVEYARLAGWFSSVSSAVPLRRLVTINVTPPEVEQRDPLSQVQIAQAKLAMGYSKHTVFGGLGDDFEAEQALKTDEPVSIGPGQAGSLAGAMESCDSVEEAVELTNRLFGDSVEGMTQGTLWQL